MLLLDEPASGLSVEETQDVAFWVEDIKKQMGITVIMVEHDMHLVASVSDRVLALADGKMLAEVAGAIGYMTFNQPDWQEATIAAARSVMERAAAPAVHLDVPLVVDAGQGANWAAAH